MSLLDNLQELVKAMGNGLEMHQLVKVSHIAYDIKDLCFTISSISFAIVQCPNLPDPQNGRVSQRGNKPGDRASYTCNSGYELVGQSSRTCQNNGQWSGDAPTCESKWIVDLFSDL